MKSDLGVADSLIITEKGKGETEGRYSAKFMQRHICLFELTRCSVRFNLNVTVKLIVVN